MQEALESSLTQSYCSKGRFQHKTADRIKLFPFTTNSVKPLEEDELSGFLGISGVVSRQISGLAKCKSLDIDTIKPALQAKIDTQDFDRLLDVVRMLAFDERGAVAPFSLSAFPYLSLAKDTSTLREIGRFITDSYFSSNANLLSSDLFEPTADRNVLHSLIHAAFPKLEKAPRREKLYHRVDVGLEDVFERDWFFLRDNPSLLHSNFPEFLQLYGLQYQLRVAERFNQFFGESELEPIYFTLQWESCSANRLACQAGWRRVEPKVKSLFSHVNCLELLNHIEVEGLAKPFTYQDLKHWCADSEPEARRSFEDALDCLIDFYKNAVAPASGWETHEPLESNDYACSILNKAKLLWLMVDCQFKHSKLVRSELIKH